MLQSFNLPLAQPIKLSVLLRELARRPQDEVSDWVVVVSDRLASEPSRLQWNRAAAGKRIEHRGCLTAIGDLHQFPGDA